MAQEDYKTYRLFNIPSDVDVLVDSIPAVENTWYANNKSLEIVKKNADDYGEPFAVLEYQTADNDILSEIVPIAINFEVDSGTPAGVNSTTTILNSTTTNLKSILGLNDSTDRIEIVSFDQAGSIQLNGIDLKFNQIILRKELDELKFISGATGFGDNYNDIVYKAGNKNGIEATEYTCTMRIVGQASLIHLSTNSYEEDGIIFQTDNLEVINGIPGGVASIKITVALNGGQSSESYILFDGVEYTNDSPALSVSLNNTNGSVSMSLLSHIAVVDKPETGTITVTLLAINGDPANVSGTNQVVINLNMV